ncbi:hypothetical protein ACET3Z_018391 [Daucus carota]
MDKYIIRGASNNPPNEAQNNTVNIGESSGKRARLDTDLPDEDIVSDPAKRKSINEYEPKVRDDVRRKYVQMGPCKPISHTFPGSTFGDRGRSFQATWLNKWDWLEYSVSKDAAFCFWCYLFGDKRPGDQAFTKKGFRNWKNAISKFKDHVGTEGSIHKNAQTLYFCFKDQRQSITRKMSLGIEVTGAAYRTRLTASVDVVRLILGLGLAFRGNDESSTSIRKGNFLEILSWYSLRNIDVGKVVKQNAPANHQLTSPYIQKQIVSACASETTKTIISDIGDKYFSLLLDEARDNSIKEQMAVVIRYVNNLGEVLERFVGVVHVKDTTALSLKSAIENFLLKHGLSMLKIRGQGYDGASNMRGQLNGLKSLILNENIGEVAKNMVEVGYHMSFPLVYLLIELILVLPVATATVERAFSAMNIVKSNLRNKMGDDFLTGCLVCYIEKDLFTAVDTEAIIQNFQNMTTRKADLSHLRTG